MVIALTIRLYRLYRRRNAIMNQIRSQQPGDRAPRRSAVAMVNASNQKWLKLRRVHRVRYVVLNALTYDIRGS